MSIMQNRTSSVSNTTHNGTAKSTSTTSTSSSAHQKNIRAKKKISYVTVLLWTIGLVAILTGVVNFANGLKEQGNLPSGLTFSVNFGGDHESQYSIGSTKGQVTATATATMKAPPKQDEKAGTHFLPPPRNNVHGGAKTPKSSLGPKYDLSKVLASKNITTGHTETEGHILKQELPVVHVPTLRPAMMLRQGFDSKQKLQVQEKEQLKGKVHSVEYFMKLSERDKHDKERLLLLIRNNAGLKYISKTTYNELPRWSQVTAMYGSQPTLVGLGQCEKFKQNGDLGDKFLAAAGIFNSGTNLLAKTLVRNCVLHKRQEKYGSKNRGIRWQVPYGKHTPPKDEEFRNSHVAKKSEGVESRQVLPAVMIRDPFRWLQSMCSHHYTTRWPRVFGQKDIRYHCPNLFPTEDEKTKLALLGRRPLVEGHAIVSETATVNEKEDTAEAGEGGQGDSDESDDNESKSHRTKDMGVSSKLTLEELDLHHFPVRVKYSNFTRHHRSLVHFFNEWYQEYLDLHDFPHLMVRMEDLLFFPDQVVPQICECAGGILTFANSTQPGNTHIRIVAESAKSKHSTKFMAEGQEHTGYLDALIRYGKEESRYKGMTPHDLQYAGQYLDKNIMDLFQYGYPTVPSTASSKRDESNAIEGDLVE